MCNPLPVSFPPVQRRGRARQAQPISLTTSHPLMLHVARRPHLRQLLSLSTHRPPPNHLLATPTLCSFALAATGPSLPPPRTNNGWRLLGTGSSLAGSLAAGMQLLRSWPETVWFHDGRFGGLWSGMMTIYHIRRRLVTSRGISRKRERFKKARQLTRRTGRRIPTRATGPVSDFRRSLCGDSANAGGQ